MLAVLVSVTFFLLAVNRQGDNNEKENRIYSVVCNVEHLQKADEAELYEYSWKIKVG